MKFYKKDEYAITLIEHVSSVDEVLTACRQSKKQRYFYYQNRRLLVNQQPITQNCQLKQGDELAVRVFIDETIDFLPDSLPLDIVYEDEVLLIVNKPPGLIVHPDQKDGHGTLANASVLIITQAVSHMRSARFIALILKPAVWYYSANALSFSRCLMKCSRTSRFPAAIWPSLTVR